MVKESDTQKVIKRYSDYHTYEPVFKDMEQWPVTKLSQDRSNFVEQIDAYTLEKLSAKSNDTISDMIAKTIYLERIRLKEEPWKVDPPNEQQFWGKIRKKLLQQSLDKEQEESRQTNRELLQKIIHRYSEEIVSTFNPKTFLFARKFLTVFFNRLLNTAASRWSLGLFGQKHKVHERFIVEGEIEKVRNLFHKGTVVIVPTHFSNIDSILLGYIMDSVMGLPSFSWGAGLNLYNTGYTAYFMNRLGTYRIDRRKKNPIYLETLKAMSNLSIQRGVNSLFFLGGTRSRSGSLEKNVKLGLLGTTVEAQRCCLERGEDQKIFIVPLVMSYHFVLEAKFLIDQHLKKTGKEHYLKTKDQSYSRRKVMKFIWQLFSKGSDITLSFGKPMDVVGNFVNEEGQSLDRHGNVLNIDDYFKNAKGAISKDLQREAEYTRILGNRIVDRFHKDNIVLSSHLVAYAAFNLLRFQHSNLDLYGLLRLPPEDFIFTHDALGSAIEQLKERLFDLQKAGKIKLSKQIYWATTEIIGDGVTRMGNFHALKPLYFNKKGNIVSDDFRVLYYYHNRLENYDLYQYVNWKKPEMAFAEF